MARLTNSGDGCGHIWLQVVQHGGLSCGIQTYSKRIRRCILQYVYKLAQRHNALLFSTYVRATLNGEGDQ